MNLTSLDNFITIVNGVVAKGVVIHFDGDHLRRLLGNGSDDGCRGRSRRGRWFRLAVAEGSSGGDRFAISIAAGGGFNIPGASDRAGFAAIVPRSGGAGFAFGPVSGEPFAEREAAFTVASGSLAIAGGFAVGGSVVSVAVAGEGRGGGRRRSRCLGRGGGGACGSRLERFGGRVFNVRRSRDRRSGLGPESGRAGRLPAGASLVGHGNRSSSFVRSFVRM
jgi:hypothetical protein